MTTAPRKLTSILFKNERGAFQLAFCRERICSANPQLQSLAKRPCPNCYVADGKETMADVARKLDRGDA